MGIGNSANRTWYSSECNNGVKQEGDCHKPILAHYPKGLPDISQSKAFTIARGGGKLG